MRRFLRWSSRIYRGILLMYPWELRLQYGEEMASVFEADLSDALDRRSAAAVFRVWWHAISEMPGIALPGRLASAAGFPGSLAGPVVSLVLHVAVIAGIFAIVTIFREGVPHGVLHGLVSLNLRPQ